jgi:tryptophan 2,3-dioxygenase
MSNEDGPKPITYGSYLKVPQLLDLQECLSEPVHHDELQFIVIHQAYELWFKLVLFELDAVAEAMDRDEVSEAVLGMDRVVAIQKLLVKQIHILETMDPLQFTRFRDHLRPASGFQSYQFRELEYVGGVRDERFLRAFRNEPHAEERLRRRLEQPSLWDRFSCLLERNGLPMPAGEEEERRDERLDSLARLYEERTQRLDLYLLAERLIAWDEAVILWRHHHCLVVERMIGGKKGTGGSDGVGYLRNTLEVRLFPELWAVRSRLGEEHAAYGGGPGPGDLDPPGEA